MRKHKKIASLLINEVDPKSDPEPDPDPDPKFPEKSDPDPKKIILDPQHCKWHFWLVFFSSSFFQPVRAIFED